MSNNPFEQLPSNTIIPMSLIDKELFANTFMLL